MQQNRGLGGSDRAVLFQARKKRSRLTQKVRSLHLTKKQVAIQNLRARFSIT